MFLLNKLKIHTKIYYFAIIAILFLIDQFSKIAILKYLPEYKSLNIIPGINFIKAYNSGAAFGLLSDAGGWQRWFFVSIAVAVILTLVIWIIKLKSNSNWQLLSLSLILGGALGNLLDRMLWGYVVDFIDFYIYDWHWYTFNFADCWITLGAILFFFSNLKD